MDFPQDTEKFKLVGGEFVDKGFSAGLVAGPSSHIPAKWMNNITKEMLGVIKNSEQLPDEDVTNQLIKAIEKLSIQQRGLNWCQGLRVTNNVADSDHSIDVSAGSIVDSTLTRVLTLPSAFTKIITSNFAVGSGNGAFSNQSIFTAGNFYKVFIVGKDQGSLTGKAVDGSLVEDAADIVIASNEEDALNDDEVAANGFVFARRLKGQLLIDVSDNITNFYWVTDNHVRWKNRVLEYQITTDDNSGTNITIACPPLLSAELSIEIRSSAPHNGARVLDMPGSDYTALTSFEGFLADVRNDGGGTAYGSNSTIKKVKTDSLSRVFFSTLPFNTNKAGFTNLGYFEDLEIL